MKYLFYILLFASTTAWAQQAVPFKIYNKKGRAVSYKKMVQATAQGDVVLFGEFHDNSIVHWLQLKLTQDLAKKRSLVLGAEMFEADNQAALSSYVEGRIDAKEMDTLVRLWNNYKTDYKPLVDFALNQKLTFVATNVPRRYASVVFKQGVQSLEALSDLEKTWMAPLPFPYDPELPGYKKMMEMFKDHANENLPKAQAVKDATMAFFIQKNLEENQLFLHFNGSYHSDHFEGIYWYLMYYNPHLKVKTIATISQSDVESLEPEHRGMADFIIVTAEDITKTF